MAIDSVAAFNEALTRHRLLEPEQLTQLARVRLTDPRVLAKELLQRGYLTAYQVNQLFQGSTRDLVLGPYVLLERLGEGGMGQVYKARHQKMGRTVALKVIRKDKLTDPKAVERFRREIKAVSQMSHPNVIKAFDADQIDDAYFMIMEYADGVDLGRLVRDKGPLRLADACEYVRQAALGLQHVHECALVHRDIKPSNLLLTRSGPKGPPVIKLLDLGLALLHWTAGEDSATLTRVGMVVGTPEFMAPEQARNSHLADIRSDLYSLGCTFYYLLAGVAPITGETSTETLLKQCFEEPRPIEELRPDVPPRVQKILTRLLAKNPDERYQTPAKLVQALSRPGLLSGGPSKPPNKMAGVLAAPEPQVRADAPERLKKVAQKRLWLRFLLVGAGLFTVLFVTVVGTWLAGRAPISARQTADARTGGTVPSTELRRSLLDALEAKHIPAEERFSWQPRELVGLLGSHRGRHWGGLHALAVSPDGRLLATGGQDGQVNLLELNSFKPHALLREESGQPVTALAFSPEGGTLAIGYFDGAIALYDVAQSPPRKTSVLRLPRRYRVEALAFSPTAPLLAVACNDDVVRLWDFTRGDKAEPTLVRGHTGGVLAVAFSPDGRLLASAGRGDFSVRVWDMKGHDAVARHVLPGHQYPVTALTFNAKGTRLVSTSAGRGVRVWDLVEGKPINSVTEVNKGNFVTGALSRDGLHLACVSNASNGVHIWDLSGSEPRDQSALGPATQGTVLMVFGNTGRTLVTFGNLRLQSWDITVTPPRLLLGADDLEDHYSAVAFSRDGKRLATGGRRGRLTLWELGGSEPARQAVWEAHSRVNAVQFSPDGKLLASAGSESRAALWDVTANHRELARFAEHSNSVSSVLFTADGHALFTASYDHSVRIYDLGQGPPRVRPDPLSAGDAVLALALDPAGRMLAGLVRDYGVRLWDLSNPRGVFRADLRLLTGKVFFGDLALAPSGRTLAVGIPAGTIRLFDTAAREPTDVAELTLPVGRGAVHALAYSPDGHWLATGYNSMLHLWDTATKKTVRDWEMPGPIDKLAFAPDGRHLATVNADGTIYIVRVGKGGP